MEQDSNHSGLCKMGCGFYGNHSFEGMCSKCYKDHLKRQQQSSPSAGRSSPGTGACGSMSNPIASPAPIISSSTTEVSPVPMSITSSVPQATPPINIPAPNDGLRTPEKGASSSLVEEGATVPGPDSPLDGSLDSSPGKLKKRNRCYSCRKKVGLTGFECRCGGLFCGLHRYSDKHNCTFDYKADGREQLTKANPVVVGEKIKKI